MKLGGAGEGEIVLPAQPDRRSAGRSKRMGRNLAVRAYPGALFIGALELAWDGHTL